MSQPDEFLTRFNEAPDDPPYDPYHLEELRAMSTDALRAWVRRHDPAIRPATPAGGSPRLTDETPGPA